MRKWIFFSIILFCAFLQTGFTGFFRIFGASADLLLICLVAASFFFKQKTAVFFGFLCGILKDLLDIQVFGIHTLLFTVVSVLLAKLSRKLSVENSYLAAVIVFLSSILYGILARFVFSYIDNIIPLGVFWRISILQALYTACVFYFIFRFFKRLIQI